MKDRTYIAIDLKSFYASVECVERGYDPLNTNLVVADSSRTDKTICLAVSPGLKSFGVPGRPRLFEVIQIVNNINLKRQRAYGQKLRYDSIYMDEVNYDKSARLSYVVAPPRMQFYIDYSNKIFNIYLKYIAPEDIHVYSIDEVFIDCTAYLNTYKMSARELAMKMVKEVFETTGITATVGIGTNLYLCKVAMDIVAKHMPADKDGVRIAYLDEKLYKEQLWDHLPLTDFWRIGKGIETRLNNLGLYTLGDVARCSINKEDILYKEFGINAELLIDHAWGIEPCTMKEIKTYRPMAKSLSKGQVLARPYRYDEVRTVVKEMCDDLILDMVEQGYITDEIVLTIGYDIINLKEEAIYGYSSIVVKKDYYGREAPKSGHGTVRLEEKTSSTTIIMDKTLELFERITNPDYLVRRINICFANLSLAKDKKQVDLIQQFSLFEDAEVAAKRKDQERKDLVKEKKLQEAIITIKNKYGKNSLLKGTNFEQGATQRDRNKFIGGHKA